MEVQASMTDEEIQVTSRIAASLVDTLESVTAAADVASCMGALVAGDLGGDGDGGEMEALLPLLAPGRGVGVVWEGEQCVCVLCAVNVVPMLSQFLSMPSDTHTQSTPCIPQHHVHHPPGQDMLADTTCVWLGDVLLTLLQQAEASGLSKQQSAEQGDQGDQGDPKTTSLAWPVLWDKLFTMLLGHVEFLHKVIVVAREGGPEQQGMVDVVRSMVPKAVMHKAMSFTTSAQRSKLRPLLMDMTH